ncbi:MAG: hypothetical protein NUV51_08090, partial [Sulfuricaulis sp.]|nr:hypothetical protein [Sulfuricaulis sp.]
KPGDVLLGQHLSAAVRSAEMHFGQAAFTFVCLPYEAFFSLDAIVRTMWRMLISRRRLLEWNPSNDTGRNNSTGLAASCRIMWVAPAIAAAEVIFIMISGPAALAVAGPVLGLWFASPAIVWWISRPLARHEARLTDKQTIFLRKISRKTWAYFETFVGPEDHWLPPDNYQESPVAGVAHRTSPTNMGLTLLANLSAHDFGYISTGQLIERTSNTFHTMKTMERNRGHFYNWYDTRSLKPLLPAYISTVDSGNLAAHLLTLRQGMLALPDQKILGARVFDGLSDTLTILAEIVGNTEEVTAQGVNTHEAIAHLQKDMESAYNSPPTTLMAARLCLDQLAVSAGEVVAAVATQDTADDGVGPNNQINNHNDNHNDNQAAWWAHAFAGQCRAALHELTFHAPWTLRPASPDSLNDFPGISGEIPTLRQLANLDTDNDAVRRARERIAAIEQLASQSSEFARMEYDFLFDKECHLLTIGYNVCEHRRDTGYYDLLASEARLCNFVAIAQGQLPQESWFALGRLLTTTCGEPVLLSWSGSMFEYLMPLLVMPTYENTLLDQTCKAAVARQIEYGEKRAVPWGISESGYNAIDISLSYQYQAFGVPGLGLKRGLAGDLVIAPYASALALIVAPEEACVNLERLSAEGFEGRYGFYEAIDYTPSRLSRGQSFAVVRSFMAHHVGMSLLSLAYLLLDRPMQKRFESDPVFQATMLLLQER